MSDGRQTVAGAYAKIEGHEELCAERYQRIRDDIGGLKKAIGAATFAILGWALLQVYSDLREHSVTPPVAVEAGR